MTQHVINDLNAIGRKARVISGYQAAIKKNEYRVAFRIGLKTYKSDKNNNQYYDFHFMKQDIDGRWSDKQGQDDSKQYDFGQNPDNISWDFHGIVGYYDSDIVYLAVTVDENKWNRWYEY